MCRCSAVLEGARCSRCACRSRRSFECALAREHRRHQLGQVTDLEIGKDGNAITISFATARKCRSSQRGPLHRLRGERRSSRSAGGARLEEGWATASRAPLLSRRCAPQPRTQHTNGWNSGRRGHRLRHRRRALRTLPELTEGKLTRLRASLVREEALADWRASWARAAHSPRQGELVRLPSASFDPRRRARSGVRGCSSTPATSARRACGAFGRGSSASIRARDEERDRAAEICRRRAGLAVTGDRGAGRRTASRSKSSAWWMGSAPRHRQLAQRRAGSAREMLRKVVV